MNRLEIRTESLARRIAAGLSKMALAIRRKAWKETGARHITPLQAETLLVLRGSADGASTVSLLAAELAIALPTASEVVGTLARKGLLQKQRSRDDARVIKLRLSNRGKRVADELAARTDFLAFAVDQLGAGEQEQLLNMLFIVLRHLHTRGDLPPVRMCLTCRFFHQNVHPDLERRNHCSAFDLPFGDRYLRIDCPKHAGAPTDDELTTLGTSARSLAPLPSLFPHRDRHFTGHSLSKPGTRGKSKSVRRRSKPI